MTQFTCGKVDFFHLQMEAVGCWWYIFGDVGLIMSPNYRRQRRFMCKQKQNGWCGHFLKTLIPSALSLANRNFLIGTFDATVYHMTADGTTLEKLFVEPRDAIYAISCHPFQPLIAVGSVCGMIKVWNYEKKEYLFSRFFEKGLGVQSLAYNPEGMCTLTGSRTPTAFAHNYALSGLPKASLFQLSLWWFFLLLIAVQQSLPQTHSWNEGSLLPSLSSGLSFQEPCLELDSPRGQFIFWMRCR